jgi:CRP-like cAMP-binding protein
LSEYVNYLAKELFIKKDQVNKSEYFVLEGVCRSFLVNPDGMDITLSFFTGSSILSPHTTRITNGRSTLNFESLTDLKLGVMDASKFAELMVGNIEIREFANTVLRNELIAKVHKEIGMASLTAKERLLHLRDRFPLLENLVPHTHIATYLGITNISLSRLRRELMS